jgi:hypothetical protein
VVSIDGGRCVGFAVDLVIATQLRSWSPGLHYSAKRYVGVLQTAHQAPDDARSGQKRISIDTSKAPTSSRDKGRGQHPAPEDGIYRKCEFA